MEPSTNPPFFDKTIGLECFGCFDVNNILRGMELAGYGNVKLDTLAVAEGDGVVCIKSLVAGSAKNYTCNVVLTWDSLLGEYTFHESGCTCPHGTNCKHCAAILLLLTADWSTGKPVPRWTPPVKPAKVDTSLVHLDSESDGESVDKLFFKKTSPPRNYPSEYKTCLPRGGSPWKSKSRSTSRNSEDNTARVPKLPGKKRTTPEPVTSPVREAKSPPHKRKASSARVSRPTFLSTQQRKVQSDRPQARSLAEAFPITPNRTGRRAAETPATKELCQAVDIDTPKVPTPDSRKFSLRDVPPDLDFDLLPTSHSHLITMPISTKNASGKKKSPMPTRQCAVTSTLCSLPPLSPTNQHSDSKDVVSFVDLVDYSLERSL
eukprot:TRINITY_DN7670_c2_g1_i1.p1 TRINITY_DN7670_c2_g1~~TRINITY_DN7670_c2_g1_i1.p1  ORF type:complete len:388 (+),score=56.36 TRINITY_DN7670_c2_g1_i1:37-1164(+)